MRRKWTDEMVKEAILERKASGTSMRVEVVRKEDSGLVSATFRRFGGWYRALEEAGLVSDEYVTHKPAGYWTKDRILSEIAVFGKEGRPLNHRFVWKNHKGLGKAARRVFGSWRNAVEAAGIDYGSVMLHKGRQPKWTDKTVKKAILALHASGNDMSERAVRREDYGLTLAAWKRFGGWYKALESAGINPEEYMIKKSGGYWTKERVLSEIVTLKANGRPLSSNYAFRNYRGLGMAAFRIFGSWRKAIQAADIDYGSVNLYKSWSKETVIEEIRRRRTQGLGMSLSEVKKDDHRLYDAARLNFGSWNDAIAQIGLSRKDVAKRDKWTKTRVLLQIKELALRGDDLSAMHCSLRHSRLFQAANKQFGNWEKAIVAAGLEYDKIRRNWLLETFRGSIFEGYVREVLKILGWNVKYHRRLKHEFESSVPDFYDEETGTWIDAKLNAWGYGTEDTIRKYSRYSDRIMIIYLGDKAREWDNESVTFISVNQFYPELRLAGAERLVNDIEMLRRGVLKPELQTELQRFISKVAPEEKEKITAKILN